jgi:hypothetical protein
MNKMKVFYVILAIAAVALCINIYAMVATDGTLDVGLAPWTGPIGGGVGLPGGGGDPLGDEDDPVEEYDCNIDLKNTGPEAEDLAIVLSGKHTVEITWDGYHSNDEGKIGWFEDITKTYDDVADETTIHWQGFNDTGDNIINTGQIIHVGWYFDGKDSQIIDMYWTDGNGERIEGSVFYSVDGDWKFFTSPGLLGIIFVNNQNTDTQISVQDIHYAYLSTKIDLGELNTENATLISTLQPVPGGENIDTPRGYQYTLALPAGAQVGTAVVLRYKVTGAGADANVLNFFQFVIQ